MASVQLPDDVYSGKKWFRSGEMEKRSRLVLVVERKGQEAVETGKAASESANREDELEAGTRKKRKRPRKESQDEAKPKH